MESAIVHLKHFHRIATCGNKLNTHKLELIQLASSVRWFRVTWLSQF